MTDRTTTDEMLASQVARELAEEPEVDVRALRVDEAAGIVRLFRRELEPALGPSSRGGCRALPRRPGRG